MNASSVPSQTPKTDHIFIYGSLLPDVPHSRFSLLEPTRWIASASLPGVLYDLTGYPGAILNPRSTSRVHGEIYQLLAPDQTLPKMDRYEGFTPHSPEGCEFKRVLHSATLEDGREIQLWIYEYNLDPQGLPIIASGNYRNRDSQ